MTVTGADGEQIWEAQVRTSRTLPVPGCGMPIQPDGKTAEELVLEDLRRLH